MKNVIRFTSIMAKAKPDKKVIMPDENGYYDVTLGALGVTNTSGEKYPLAPAKVLFENDSILMRRVNNGQLRGEQGHPKRLPGMTPNDFLRRVISIEESRISHHIKELYLVNTGKDSVDVKGLVRPTDARGGDLKECLDNPDENTAFSLRSLTRDHYDGNGTLIKEIISIVTWDYVNEPGIAKANMWSDLGVEDDLIITPEMVENLLEENVRFGNESNNDMLTDLLDVCIEGVKPVKNTIYNIW